MCLPFKVSVGVNMERCFINIYANNGKFNNMCILLHHIFRKCKSNVSQTASGEKHKYTKTFIHM